MMGLLDRPPNLSGFHQTYGPAVRPIVRQATSESIFYKVKELVESVRRGELEGASQEGVVGKAQQGKKLLWFKTKTNWWRSEVKRLYSPEEADKILNS